MPFYPMKCAEPRSEDTIQDLRCGYTETFFFPNNDKLPKKCPQCGGVFIQDLAAKNIIAAGEAKSAGMQAEINMRNMGKATVEETWHKHGLDKQSKKIKTPEQLLGAMENGLKKRKNRKK